MKASLEEARHSERFAGKWALERAGLWAPGLTMLVRRGILKHEDTTRGGRRAYYTMPDKEGVAQALRELGVES